MGHIHDTKYGLHMHIYLLFFPHEVEKEKVRLTKREKKLTDTINLITFFF